MKLKSLFIIMATAACSQILAADIASLNQSNEKFLVERVAKQRSELIELTTSAQRLDTANAKYLAHIADMALMQKCPPSDLECNKVLYVYLLMAKSHIADYAKRQSP